MKSIKDKFLTESIAISKNSITQLAVTCEDSIINMLPTKKNMLIKEVSGNDNEVNNINVLNVNSIGSIKIKLAKLKNLVLLKNTKIDFFIPRTRLTFINSRQAFIKVPIIHYFDLKYHIYSETDISGYAINKVSSQLSVNNFY